MHFWVKRRPVLEMDDVAVRTEGKNRARCSADESQPNSLQKFWLWPHPLRIQPRVFQTIKTVQI